MKLNHIKVFDDSDFEYITELCQNHSGWNMAYNKKDIVKVWTKSVPNSNFHMIKVFSLLFFFLLLILHKLISK